jgi:hypothetical protein
LGKNQHVVPHNGKWAVRGAGNEKVTRVVNTQAEAIKIAQDIAKNQQSDTKIHGRDGQIRAGNSYGNDPYPPKDKK